MHVLLEVIPVLEVELVRGYLVPLVQNTLTAHEISLQARVLSCAVLSAIAPRLIGPDFPTQLLSQAKALCQARTPSSCNEDQPSGPPFRLVQFHGITLQTDVLAGQQRQR